MGSEQTGDAEVFIGQCCIPSRTDTADLLCGLSRLPTGLHADINRYQRLEDRLARLTARLLLRKILQRLDFIRESTLEGWCRSPEGRPFFQESRVDFSISHTSPWVVSAVALNCRIGIDVELYRSLDINSFAPYLTGAELKRVREARYPDREVLHCWSMREAILKADGRGLLIRDDSIRNICSVKTPAGRPWQVEQLDFTEGSLYLASDCRHPHLHREQWNFEELLPA